MSEFEKDFPSLKDFISDKGKEYESVFSNHIQKHCLDKKKVREAIQKARGNTEFERELDLFQETMDEFEEDREPPFDYNDLD